MSRKTLIENAVREIESVPEGCIVNVDGRPKWYEFWVAFVYWEIRKTQKGVFGPKSRFRHTHSMVKFRNETIRKVIGGSDKVQEILKKTPNATTFSVQPPAATLVPTEHYALSDISVYQYTKRNFDNIDISLLLQGTLPILLKGYNYGELVDILRSKVAGYPEKRGTPIFTFPGKNSDVCSVGCSSDYTFLRHEDEKRGISIPRIFSKLNPAAWTRDFFNRFYNECGGKWDVERTYPACFANTDSHFDGEFELVLRMNKGVVIYKK